MQAPTDEDEKTDDEIEGAAYDKLIEDLYMELPEDESA